jgi:sulfite reductase (NADPH) flavoprotein alpha-component
MSSRYDRSRPFIAAIQERYRLNHEHSSKEVWHVVADISGSGISYRPGDSFAIFPENDPRLVDEVLKAMRAHGDEEVFDERSKENFLFAEWLKKKANLAFCTRKLLCLLAERIKPESHEKKALESLLQEDQEALCTEFLHSWNVPEFLTHYAEKDLITPQELTLCVPPLLPRFYSIACSQGLHNEQVEFLVSRVKYEVGGKSRVGTCSHFLCDLVKTGEKSVPLYLHPTKDFLLPEYAHTPIIMIGPGTGVAPFRAFMQERMMGSNKTKNWLFFGERHEKYDFHYKDLWHQLVGRGFLQLSCAFSRDQLEKSYVQHKLWDERNELWKWLQEGATIYVCGDKERMAKDVDQILHTIIQDQSGKSSEEAKAELSSLRKNKRYLRDVY